MRILTGLLMVLVMVAAVQADTVLLSEDFDGTGASSGSTINGYNGWSGDDSMVFCDTVIDSGLSAGATDSVSWPNVAKGFSNTPSAGDSYTLTAVLYIPQTRAYASVEMDMSGVMPLYAGLGAGSSPVLEFGFYPNEDWSGLIKFKTYAVSVDTAYDIKLDVTDGNADCYFRDHGATEWTSVGSLTDEAIVLADFNRIKVSNRGDDYTGGRTDTILLTAVPEPATMSLLAMGGLGVLLRRKR
jgi:hypothetical protein